MRDLLWGSRGFGSVALFGFVKLRGDGEFLKGLGESEWMIGVIEWPDV